MVDVPARRAAADHEIYGEHRGQDGDIRWSTM
jgi:hypothetical protein